VTQLPDHTEPDAAPPGKGEYYEQSLNQLQSGALHNIGNIVTVSHLTLHEAVQDREIIEGLELIVRKLLPAIEEHVASGDVADFLQNDEHGREYLGSIKELLIDHRHRLDEVAQKLNDVSGQLLHVGEILEIHRRLARGLGQPRIMSVTRPIENAITLMAAAARRERIQVHRDFQHTADLTVDSAVLTQVFTNLVRNAVHALQETEGRDRQIWVSSAMADDGRVVVLVRDNGCGLDADRLARIFEYGYTTKADGSGVGLHYCRTAVEQFGGSISATSTTSEGTTFTIYLKPS
jgi:two-component system NtrC family sensor kinase